MTLSITLYTQRAGVIYVILLTIHLNELKVSLVLVYHTVHRPIATSMKVRPPPLGVPIDSMWVLRYYRAGDG